MAYLHRQISALNSMFLHTPQYPHPQPPPPPIPQRLKCMKLLGSTICFVGQNFLWKYETLGILSFRSHLLLSTLFPLPFSSYLFFLFLSSLTIYFPLPFRSYLLLLPFLSYFLLSSSFPLLPSPLLFISSSFLFFFLSCSLP